MVARLRRYGPAIAGALLIVLGGAPPGHTYKGKGERVGSGGGLSAGGGYRTMAAVGMLTMGSSSSASHTHQEGVLALYGRPVLYSEPGSLAFGTVSSESHRDLTATVVNYGGVGLLLSDLDFSSGGGSGYSIVSPAGSTVVDPGDSLSVVVRFEPPADGTVYDTLEGTTNDPIVPLWTVALSGTGQTSLVPDIVIAVDTLDFGPVPADSAKSLTLVVENVGGADLVVDSIRTSDPVFSVEPDGFAVTVGGHQDVTVTFEPDEAATWSDSLSVWSNDADDEGPVVIRLEGRVPSLLALVEPASGSLHFHAAEDGPPPTDGEIRIRNDGAETLHWSVSVDGAGGWCATSPDSGSVPPGNSTTIDVSADHTGLVQGVYAGSVILMNEDRPATDRDTVAVELVVAPFTVTTEYLPLVPEHGENVHFTSHTSVSIDSAYLYYRQGGKANWNQLVMSVRNDTTCQATVAGELVGMRGLEYYVHLFGPGGDVADPPIDAEGPYRVVVSVSQIFSPPTVALEYALIGVPLLTLANQSHPSQVFPDDLGEHDISSWRLGRWHPESGSYAEYPNEMGVAVEAGTGFWLITRESSSYALDGFSVFPPPGDSVAVIGLPGGTGSWWSQIGQPFAYPVEWDRCMVRSSEGRIYPMNDQPDDGLVETAAYTYVYSDGVGGYEEAAILDPWKAYFVNNLSGGDVELLVPAREAMEPTKTIAARAALRPEEGEWEIRLRARSDDGASASIMAGARAGSQEGWDGADRHQPPSTPAGGPALSLVPLDPMPQRGALRADIRPPSADLTEWEMNLRFRGARESVVEVADGSGLADGIDVFLLDDTEGVTVPLRAGSAYRATAGRGETCRTLRLVAGPTAILASSGYEATEEITDLRLGRPFPNPALRGAAIRYALPSSGHVRLQVFAVNGRRVRDLVDDVRPAGEHVALWDGRDESGREVGPGLYFFRLVNHADVRTARVVVFR